MKEIAIDKKMIDLLSALSLAAGEAIMEVYQLADVGIEQKLDDSPVTLADKAANEIICQGLSEHYPDIPIISEEYALPEYEERQSWTYCWIVDPLDGTKEFIKKNGEFTTNIALVKDGVPVVGVVYAPATGALYVAAIGQGAYRVAEGKQIPLQVRSYDPQGAGVAIACSKSHLGTRTMSYIEKYVDPLILRVGSSLKMMLIAEGRADIYPKPGPISEWDVAASHCIVTEAGGSITTLEGGLPIRYNKKSMFMPHFLAEGKRISS